MQKEIEWARAHGKFPIAGHQNPPTRQITIASSTTSVVFLSSNGIFRRVNFLYFSMCHTSTATWQHIATYVQARQRQYMQEPANLQHLTVTTYRDPCQQDRITCDTAQADRRDNSNHVAVSAWQDICLLPPSSATCSGTFLSVNYSGTCSRTSCGTGFGTCNGTCPDLLGRPLSSALGEE